MEQNTQVLLKWRPVGEPAEDNFEVVQRPIPEPGPGEVLCRTIYLSLDPYMRGLMRAGKSYAKPVEVGEVMAGGTVGQVVQSDNPQFASGQFVLGHGGWQEYSLSDGQGLRVLDPKAAPISYALGVLGMPGLTAYAGLLDVGRPQPGQTVVVSAAAGAVGSVVGQIAKIKGCRVVGSAGSDEKCKYVVEELGFDACINYKTHATRRGLLRVCPDGIDVYFDNTAGPMLDAVLQNLKLHARIVLVGLISQYNATEPPTGPNLMPLLIQRASVQGFLVSDHAGRTEEFLRDMTAWLREGKVKFRQDIREGLSAAPRAFIGLFRGENFGKLLIRASDDPTAGTA